MAGPAAGDRVAPLRPFLAALDAPTDVVVAGGLGRRGLGQLPGPHAVQGGAEPCRAYAGSFTRHANSGLAGGT